MIVDFHTSSQSFSDKIEEVTDGGKMILDLWDYDLVEKTCLEVFLSHAFIVR